jgi:hypothetical protein
MTDDWQMPRPAKACFACAHPFGVEESFRACLYATAGSYERRDFCGRCAAPAEPSPLATWLARVPVPASKKVQPFDREAVYRFFQRLEDEPDAEKVQFRFVLALLLWRKKVLKLERTVTEPEESWEFRVPATGELHRVPRPDLGEEHLEQLSLRVEQLLAAEPGDLNAADAEVQPHA